MTSIYKILILLLVIYQISSYSIQDLYSNQDLYSTQDLYPTQDLYSNQSTYLVQYPDQEASKIYNLTYFEENLIYFEKNNLNYYNILPIVICMYYIRVVV